MARRPVVEIECARCGRVDIQAPDLVLNDGEVELELKFRGEAISFSELCRICRRVVANYVAQIRPTKAAKKALEAKTPKGSTAAFGR